jgi:hypothetical protein
MYRDIQVQFLNRIVPLRGGTATNTPEFYRSQQEACNLDGWLQPTEAFECSYLKPPHGYVPYRDRSVSDNSCFMWDIACQRDSSGPFGNDGITTKQSETITLTGAPLRTEQHCDTYYYLNRHNKVDFSDYKKDILNGTPPIICLVSPAFWLLRSNRQAVFDTSGSWNSVFQKHCPQLFQQLSAAISGGSG